MPATPPPSQTALVIPPETQAKFGALIELIRGSESMNDEERQYWINILPIMTPEQIGNLQQILTSEKEQLASIERKHVPEIAALGEEEIIRRVDEERRNRRQQRQSAERSTEETEEQETANLLEKIQTEGA